MKGELKGVITKFNVDSKELDPEYKHLHHAKYFPYFEQGRASYMEEIGLPLPTLISQGLFPIVTGVNVKFLREVTAGECQIGTEVTNVGRREIEFSQTLFNGKNKIASVAVIECMVLSRETGRAMAMSDEWRERLLSKTR